MLLKIEIKKVILYLNVLPTKDGLNKLGNTLAIIKNVVTEEQKRYPLYTGEISQTQKDKFCMIPFIFLEQSNS